jgi:hypothetical protein
MKNPRSIARITSVITLLASVACTPAAEDEDAIAPLAQALTFHASFDNGPDADFALGNATLYTASSYDEQDEAEAGIGSPDVEIVEGSGRFGNALEFKKKNTFAVFYRAEDNVAFSGSNWSGTLSFWLSLEPAEDLEPGFTDPIQITDAAYNDAAIWVDFTGDNPRQFRLGIFGDLAVWNPDNLSANDFPFFLERLISVDPPPFARGEWTHVAITFTGLGSEDGGTANLYLNGEPQPKTMEGIGEPFTWDMSRAAIRLGVNFVGRFDELALFNRPLTPEEVTTLSGMEGGVAALH